MAAEPPPSAVESSAILRPGRTMAQITSPLETVRVRRATRDGGGTNLDELARGARYAVLVWLRRGGQVAKSVSGGVPRTRSWWAPCAGVPGGRHRRQRHRR